MYYNFIFKIKKHFDDEGSFWKVSRNKKVNKIKNNIINYEQTKAGLNPRIHFLKVNKSNMYVCM